MSELTTEPRTAREMLARAREFLARKGATEARLDAELLVAHALGLKRLPLFLDLERPVNGAEVARARELLMRRGKREPVAYITGSREFYGLEFEVDASVLIPRPETELLIDLARERTQSGARVADVGTGSGCIAITLARWLESASVHAVDISAAALDVARRNAQRLGARVEFVEGDGPRALASSAPFDALISNPPYVARAETATLEPEVRDWEPELALFLPDGDAEHWLRRLLDEGVPLLAADGVLLVELGRGQAPTALRLAHERGLQARTHRDLAGVERVLEARRTPAVS